MAKTNTEETVTTQNDEAIKAAVEAALAEQAAVHEKEMEAAVNAAVEEALANAVTKENKTATKEVKLQKIKISRDRKDQGDVEVSVNGKVWQIKRGVEVEVPDYVVEVLENTRKMDELRMERIEQATRNF